MDAPAARLPAVLAALEAYTAEAEAAVPEIADALSHVDQLVRIAAAQALWKIDPREAQKRLGPGLDAVRAGQEDRQSLRVGPYDWPQWGGSRLRNNTPRDANIPAEWDVGQFERRTGKWISDQARNIRWVARLGSETYGTPSIANGKIFIGTNNGSGYLKRYPPDIDLGVLLCFEEATGKFLWQYSSEKLLAGRAQDWPLQGLPCTPLIDGDRIWFVTNRCEVLYRAASRHGGTVVER